jgi:hypothetical protein
MPPRARLVILLVPLAKEAAGVLFTAVRVHEDVILAAGAALALQDDGLAAVGLGRRADHVVAYNLAPDEEKWHRFATKLIF